MAIWGGKWTRWGRDSCEGYRLSFGSVRDLRWQVVRNIGQPETWRATMGSTEKIFPDRESAMADVEHELRARMEQVLTDWHTYCAWRGVDPQTARLCVQIAGKN